MMQRQTKPSTRCLEWVFKCFLSSVVFFYLGLAVGWNWNEACDCKNDNSGNLRSAGMTADLKTIVKFVEEHNNNDNNNDNNAELNDMKKKLEEQNDELKKMKDKAEENVKQHLSDSSSSNKGISEETDRALAAELKTMEKLVEEHKKNEEQWAVELNDMKNKLVEQKDFLIKSKDTVKQEAPQKPHQQHIFPGRHTGMYASGIEFVDRDDFIALYDTGVPAENSGWGNDQVFLLYSDDSAMPDKNATTREYPNGSQVLSVEDATKNCRNLHIVLTAPGRKQQCVAIMGQYESFHLQKFMRMAEGEKQSQRVLDMKLPLRLVNRNMMITGEKSITAPQKEHTKAYQKILSPYLDSLESVLNELKPIAKSVASNNAHNTIIVMVCNFGHSEMLINFVCNAHAKGKETEVALKNILVFATDVATHLLAQSLGLTSFYSESVFGETPQQAAAEYGDEVYSKIMVAKVYCVHLISQLGYDLLFQDIDIVWYKDPLLWFHSEEPDHPAKNWDMIYQDDGARHLFFAPYSANTGFYFVRNNRETQYFFSQFLTMGDLIFVTGSHQAALIALLSEQASLYGLKIKTWNRNTDEFPGGHSYHQRKDYMKKMLLSKNSTEGRGLIKTVIGDNHDGDRNVDPWIFHMSWTVNKDDKLKYFQQMGEWYVKDECNSSSGKAQNDMVQNPTINSCCAAKPLIRCHYKDKPSIIPCPDAPSADKKKNDSFW